MLELLIWINSKESLISPYLLNTVIKDKRYLIPFKTMGKIDYLSQIKLFDGYNLLGIAMFYPNKTHLELTTLQAMNMLHEKQAEENNDLEIEYTNALKWGIRNKERVPVGTILMEAIKLIAYKNNIQTIELNSKTNAEEFYKKMGMNTIDGKGLRRFSTRLPRSSWCSGFGCSAPKKTDRQTRKKTRKVKRN
jgi:hypothetical protein